MTDAETSINDALERAACDLPELWVLQVCVERGAGWVQGVWDQCESWSENELEVDQTGSMASRIDQAVEVIKEIEANRDRR